MVSLLRCHVRWPGAYRIGEVDNYIPIYTRKSLLVQKKRLPSGLDMRHNLCQLHPQAPARVCLAGVGQ